MDKQENQNSEEEKKKKRKFIILIFFLVIFLVPIGFGIRSLFPDPTTPVARYDVKLINNPSGALTLSNRSAYSDSKYSAKITLNRSIITDKILPNELGESDVKCKNKPITYTYNVNSDKYSARIEIPKENIKGDITINVPLVTPGETFPVTLKANGGRFPGNLVEITLNVFAGQSLNDIAEYERPTQFREGYHFTHWELESDRTQKLYENTIIPYAQGGVTYVANCELNEIEVTIQPNGGTFPDGTTTPLKLNTLYDTAINQIAGYPGEPTKEGYKFLYYKSTIGTSITSINRTYLPTDTVTIKELVFGIEAVYAENLTITLNAGEGTFPGGAPTTFDTYRGITLDQLTGYKEPTLSSQLFTYWKDGDGNIYYRNTVLDVSGSLELTAYYGGGEQHTHEIDSYTVINNRLYGICKTCGAQLEVSDADLANYEGKFLVIENEENSSTDNYVMHDIEDMENIINTAENRSVLEMYFISGEYDLGGSRGAGQEVITVNGHGLLDSEGNPTASIDCTRTTEWPEPRHHHLINFTFENLNMIGEDDYKDGFYFGLYASTITYNHCYFKGKQSFYSYQVICNDCEFDSTGMLTEPDYAIYSYSSLNIEFNRCVFKSDGKALKIFAEGAAPGAVFKLTDCEFYNIGKIRTDKAAIEVDSQHQPADSPYNIYITRCTQDGFIGEEGNGLYHDASTHSNFIVTEI